MFFTIVLSLLMSLSFSQFKKGLKTISGTISWIKTTYEGDDILTVFTFAPSFGFFTKDNVSPFFLINYTSIDYPQDISENKDTVVSLGTGIRYYHKNVYGSGAFMITSELDKHTESSVLLEAGYLMSLSDYVYLDFGVDYNLGIGYNKTDTIVLGVGVAAFF